MRIIHAGEKKSGKTLAAEFLPVGPGGLEPPTSSLSELLI
jgi:hypothetical protein